MMAIDNAYNQSAVGYQNSPKEKNYKRGLHDGDAQFGKKKMPQDDKPATKSYVKEVMAKHVKTMHRHKEHR
jgi:hypothetical protein